MIEKMKAAFKKLPAMAGDFKKKFIYAMIAMAVYNYIVVPCALSFFGIVLPIVPLDEAMKYIFAIVSFGSM